MVTPFLSENSCFFNFFSTIKVKRVDEMMQSAYLCVVLHVKHKKLPFINRDFNLILCKNQDGDHFWWRHRPPAAPPPMIYTSSCFEYQRLSTEGKIVSKYCNISKTLGRGSIHLWPLPCTTLGVWICVYVRELSKKGNDKKLCGKRCRYLHRHASTFFDLWQLNRL